MKKTGFLVKLKKEKKIQVVEPSEEIKSAYLQRSEESLRSAKALFQINSLKDSVALTYYSMYYSSLALLFRIGIKCENHTGAIMLLKEIFGLDNKKIAAAKKERVDKQYYVDFSVTKEEVSEMIVVAEEFNSQLLHFIDTLKGRIAPHFSAEYPALLCKKDKVLLHRKTLSFLCHKVRGLESVSFKPRTLVRGETLSRTFMTLNQNKIEEYQEKVTKILLLK